MGSIPEPVKRGRDYFWEAARFVAWMRGDDEPGNWTPPPHNRPKPQTRRDVDMVMGRSIGLVVISAGLIGMVFAHLRSAQVLRASGGVDR